MHLSFLWETHSVVPIGCGTHTRQWQYRWFSIDLPRGMSATNLVRLGNYVSHVVIKVEERCWWRTWRWCKHIEEIGCNLVEPPNSTPHPPHFCRREARERIISWHHRSTNHPSWLQLAWYGVCTVYFPTSLSMYKSLVSTCNAIHTFHPNYPVMAHTYVADVVFLGKDNSELVMVPQTMYLRLHR